LNARYKKKGLRLVVFDERDGLARQCVGQVRRFPHGLFAAQNCRTLAVKVRMRSRKKPVKLVEPPRPRSEGLTAAQVPLPHEPRGVAGLLQSLGKRYFGLRQTKRAVRPLVRAGIELVSESLLIMARQQSRARGAAVGPGYITLGAAHARPRQRIDVRRRDVSATLKAQIGIAQIIGKYEYDVGLAPRGIVAPRAG
jgi:hypothetical protein